MPYHTFDPLKKSHKYDYLGNKSKNDFIQKTNTSNKKNTIKKNKYSEYYLDFYIKQKIKDLQHEKGKTVIIQSNITKKENITVKLDKQPKIEIIIENEDTYVLPILLVI